MVFNSIKYLIFFPIVLLFFYIMPRRLKNAWLLLASYVFYALWNVKYCGLLFICTLITYAAGLAISTLRADQDEAIKCHTKSRHIGDGGGTVNVSLSLPL